MERYAIIREFIYGWDWTEFNDMQSVVLYETEKEAHVSLMDYIEDINDAYKIGDISDPYQNDCKVVRVEVKDGLAYHPEISESIKIAQ